jgi:hypothetical protein
VPTVADGAILAIKRITPTDSPIPSAGGALGAWPGGPRAATADPGGFWWDREKVRFSPLRRGFPRTVNG